MNTKKTSQFGLEQVKNIAPYIGGRPISEVARQFGLVEDQIVKLASNENPLGIPESAKAAMMAVMHDLGRYPDSNGFELKQVLAKKNQVPDNWITLGNGSNDILELATRSVAQMGSEIIFSKHAFAVYPLATQAVGAKAIVIDPTPEDLGHDLTAMLAAISENTKLIFVANPNNPTGSFIPGQRIEQFLSQVPGHIVVVLDEAYNEYLKPEQQYDAIAMARKYPNLIVSRSFSKAYGLAGLRLGYAVSQEELTDLMNRIRQPFNVNSLAQAAAIAAFQDTEFLERGAKLNQAGYQQLTQAFDQMQLHYLPSAGNFILVQVGDDDRAGTRVNLELLKQGVIVRPVDNYGLPKFLRVSIGLPQENAAFLVALKKALQQ
ncbi:histidinol-phosphate aminotransferase 2 [Polynucleobacter sp. SHI8]|uniref:histidinol-phosphate transaminase n=1 Tax=unclassified Polynucleobacter TaxID=2640945 RepID=UPI0024921E3B|nr:MULTISPECIES: histidinol-phosphate transaminase [unclassified Polynucleobacter]BDW11419.1 histidinol-phosphate aminotransferase 2 [Polynucleobacter sp. SHI2]BDW13866.1 histidinol-phosphate aminotransferase 2 [Polynucleobacter sp. SHI8]